MLDVLLSCRATTWYSSDRQGKSVWSAETCQPHPSQRRAYQGLWGGGVHFLLPCPAELLSPTAINRDVENFTASQMPSNIYAAFSTCFYQNNWPERKWRRHGDGLYWNSADNDTQPRDHYPQVLLSWPSVWEDKAIMDSLIVNPIQEGNSDSTICDESI